MKKLLLTAVAFMVGMTAMNAEGIKKDPSTYEAVQGYHLQSLWIQAVTTDNNLPFGTSEVRGMATLNGELLFCRRVAIPEDQGGGFTCTIDIYDGLTGVFKKQLPLDAEIKNVSGFPCNDIQVDNAGNVLISNVSTDMIKEDLKIHKINMETGAATKVLDTNFSELSGAAYRIDAFGVYGDVDGDGFFMAAIAGDEAGIGDQVVRWNIKSGVADVANPVFISIGSYFPEVAVGNGTAPRVCPISDELFYLDGFNSSATLYDMTGVMVDSFTAAPDLAPQQMGDNGVDEFTLNGKNFIIYSYTNTVPTENPQTWSLCEMGANQAFEGMTNYAIFPKMGVGNVSNPARTALPRIEVKQDSRVALIYVYATNSGAAAYIFGQQEDIDRYINDDPIGIDNSEIANFAITTTVAGIVLSEAADVTVFNFAGQQVVAQSNAKTVALASGSYIVKAVASNGKTVASKVIIK